MPEARQNNSKLAEMLARASNFRALVGMAVDVVGLFMALLSFVESPPRAYRLKASNAAPPFSTSAGTSATPKRHKSSRGETGLLLLNPNYSHMTAPEQSTPSYPPTARSPPAEHAVFH